MPPRGQPALTVEVKANPNDIRKAVKYLDKYERRQLEKTFEKAARGALKILVGPIKSGARRHRVTGDTERSVKIKKLRKERDETLAMKVGVNTWYGHFPISGPYDAPGDPYVDEAVNLHGDEVAAFFEEELVKTLDG